jgi:putative transposase
VRNHRTPPRLENVDYRAARSYLVTFCLKNRAKKFSDPILASIACRWIRTCRDAGWYWLYAYCVMPDHIHIAMRVRDKKVHLSRIVAMIRSGILCEARRHDSSFCWQRGFDDRIVRVDDDSTEIVRYVLANPRRAGLTRGEETYPFCGVVDIWR